MINPRTIPQSRKSFRLNSFHRISVSESSWLVKFAASISIRGEGSEPKPVPPNRTFTDGPDALSRPAALSPTSAAILASCHVSIGRDARSARLSAISAFEATTCRSWEPMESRDSVTTSTAVTGFWPFSCNGITPRDIAKLLSCVTLSDVTRDGTSQPSRFARWRMALASTPKRDATSVIGTPCSEAKRISFQSTGSGFAMSFYG